MRAPQTAGTRQYDGWPGWTWPAVAAVTITLAGWLLLGSPSAEHLQFGADQARLVHEATAIREGTITLVGAYSKNGPAHPGPLYTYLLAIVVWAAGDDIVRATSIVSLIQWSTLGVMVLAVFAATRSSVIAICSVLLTLVNPTFAFYARLIWNPSIVFPALAVACLSVVLMVNGRHRTLPLLCGAVSLMVQAHVATAPIGAALLAWAAAWVVMHRADTTRGVVMASLLVLGLAWAPPLADALMHGGGNAAAWAALRQPDADWHTPREVWGTISRLVAESTPLGPWPFLAVAATLALTGFAATTPRRLRLAALPVAMAWISLTFSVAAVPGPIEIHYLRYVFVLLSLTFALAWAGLEGASGGRWWCKAAAIAMLVALTSWSLWMRPIPAMSRALASPALTAFPLSDMSRMAAAIRHGATSPRLAADLAPVRALPSRVDGTPCTFATDADLAFAVGEAMSYLVGCSQAHGGTDTRYHIRRNGSAPPQAYALVHRGQAFSLYYRPSPAIGA